MAVTKESKGGSAGVGSFTPGKPATVSLAAENSGTIDAGHFIETDVDDELFRFNSDDTPLMNLMLKAKKVKVDSPEVDHFMIDEPVFTFDTTEAVQGDTKMSVTLPLASKDQNIPRPYCTLLVPDVDGCDEAGKRAPGSPLMLFVTGQDPVTSNPVVRAVNGSKVNPGDEFSLVPDIPKGSKIVVLSNALYETQKEVDPDLVIPRSTRVYLQKRGMNQVVSDYFDAQKKRIPFTQAIIAEQAIANFKTRGNRTLWAGRAGKLKVAVPKMGMQYVYTTEGIRWQFKKELMVDGRWTIEKFISLAKMFFTGEDVPKTALLLAGKNLLEQIQCIDFSKHPEIQITQTRKEALGWDVTKIHTVFGDIEIKREPTLDRLGWSNSGALIGEDRLVHYTYSAEHSFKDRVEGEEATRSGILVWDALALKGSCHIWIDGEGGTGDGKEAVGIVRYHNWESEEAPTEEIEKDFFCLLCDCPGISEDAKEGQIWTKRSGEWAQMLNPSTLLAW